MLVIESDVRVRTREITLWTGCAAQVTQEQSRERPGSGGRSMIDVGAMDASRGQDIRRQALMSASTGSFKAGEEQ